jgi:hypothetical protein
MDRGERAVTLDLDAARHWLREHLAPDEPVHIDDPAVLDRAALLVRDRDQGGVPDEAA